MVDSLLKDARLNKAVGRNTKEKNTYTISGTLSLNPPKKKVKERVHNKAK